MYVFSYLLPIYLSIYLSIYLFLILVSNKIHLFGITSYLLINVFIDQDYLYICNHFPFIKLLFIYL